MSDGTGELIYGLAGPAYYGAGYAGVLALPHGMKAPPPAGCTGEGGIDPDPEQVEAWAKTFPDANVAIRMPSNVIGIDFDQYGMKRGYDNIEAWAIEQGLPWPLPPTWVSSARPGLKSGIRWFKVPAGRRWVPEVCESVDVIQRGHRYAVAPPSVHPEGGRYRWRDPSGEYVGAEGEVVMPRVADLAELPDEWVKALSPGMAKTAGSSSGGSAGAGGGRLRATDEEVELWLAEADAAWSGWAWDLDWYMDRFRTRCMTSTRHAAMLWITAMVCGDIAKGDKPGAAVGALRDLMRRAYEDPMSVGIMGKDAKPFDHGAGGPGGGKLTDFETQVAGAAAKYLGGPWSERVARHPEVTDWALEMGVAAEAEFEMAERVAAAEAAAELAEARRVAHEAELAERAAERERERSWLAACAWAELTPAEQELVLAENDRLEAERARRAEAHRLAAEEQAGMDRVTEQARRAADRALRARQLADEAAEAVRLDQEAAEHGEVPEGVLAWVAGLVSDLIDAEGGPEPTGALTGVVMPPVVGMGAGVGVVVDSGLDEAADALGEAVSALAGALGEVSLPGEAVRGAVGAEASAAAVVEEQHARESEFDRLIRARLEDLETLERAALRAVDQANGFGLQGRIERVPPVRGNEIREIWEEAGDAVASLNCIDDRADGVRAVESWIEGEWLTRGSLITLVAAPSVGKSTILVDLACRLACGMEWFDEWVDPSGTDVLYLAYEAGEAVRQRIHGWSQHQRSLGLVSGMSGASGPGPSGLWAGGGLLPLGTPARLWSAQRIAAGLATRSGLDLVRRWLDASWGPGDGAGVVVVDTLAAAFHGEENDSTAMSVLVRGIYEIMAERPGLSFVIAHHPTKDVKIGDFPTTGRGSGALAGAADIELVARRLAVPGSPGEFGPVVELTRAKNRHGSTDGTKTGLIRSWNLVGVDGVPLTKRSGAWVSTPYLDENPPAAELERMGLEGAAGEMAALARGRAVLADELEGRARQAAAAGVTGPGGVSLASSGLLRGRWKDGPGKTSWTKLGVSRPVARALGPIEQVAAEIMAEAAPGSVVWTDSDDDD